MVTVAKQIRKVPNFPLIIVSDMGVQFQILKFGIFNRSTRYAAYQFWKDISYDQQLLWMFSCTAWGSRRLTLQNLSERCPFACRSCLRVC